MARSADALINPLLLVWARRNSGYSPEEAAKKTQVSVEKYSRWETGEEYPTINQLRKLANIFKRPLAVFYLHEVPRDFQPLRDFRRLASIDKTEFTASPQLRLEIRKARYRREIAYELYDMLNEEPPDFDFSTNISINPESVAHDLRGYLGVTMKHQLKWSNDRQAMNAWRDALESAGVLVFQAQGVELEEMRGFSISNGSLPVVAVNISDVPRARIFSMLHELTHVSLNATGLCDLDDSGREGRVVARTEIFCNMVAGATIVPMSDLLSLEIVKSAKSNTEWSDEELSHLSRHFQASWETILRRLLIAGKTSQEFYNHKHEEFKEYHRDRPKKKSGFAPPSTMALSTAGPSFVRLVLDGYYQEKITASDVSDFLDVRLKHMNKIEKAVFGQAIEFGVQS